MIIVIYAAVQFSTVLASSDMHFVSTGAPIGSVRCQDRDGTATQFSCFAVANQWLQMFLE